DALLPAFRWALAFAWAGGPCVPAVAFAFAWAGGPEALRCSGRPSPPSRVWTPLATENRLLLSWCAMPGATSTSPCGAWRRVCVLLLPWWLPFPRGLWLPCGPWFPPSTDARLLPPVDGCLPWLPWLPWTPPSWWWPLRWFPLLPFA